MSIEVTAVEPVDVETLVDLPESFQRGKTLTVCGYARKAEEWPMSLRAAWIRHAEESDLQGVTKQLLDLSERAAALTETAVSGRVAIQEEFITSLEERLEKEMTTGDWTPEKRQALFELDDQIQAEKENLRAMKKPAFEKAFGETQALSKQLEALRNEQRRIQLEFIWRLAFDDGEQRDFEAFFGEAKNSDFANAQELLRAGNAQEDLEGVQGPWRAKDAPRMNRAQRRKLDRQIEKIMKQQTTSSSGESKPKQQESEGPSSVEAS